MTEHADTNDAVWKSDRGVSHWVSTAGDRERRRVDQRRLMAELLPFDDAEPFTFVDLGAGTGAAARAVLDRFPGSRAVLADYSVQMMEQGRRELAAYGDRFTYVEFDLARGPWPVGLPAEVDAVISSLCVHHLPDPRKRACSARSWSTWPPGPGTSTTTRSPPGTPSSRRPGSAPATVRTPKPRANAGNRSAEEQERYENHVRYMIPLAPQLDMLGDAGFEAIDVYWKQLDLVIYGGRRPRGARS